MKAILTDISKCIGCAQCVSACKIVNDLPADRPRNWQKADGLSAVNWTSVLHDGDHFVRKQCRHCQEAACVSVCPVGALQQTDHGAVIYDKDKCLGCRYCMMACPYGIPRYDWENPVPYVKKCIMCYYKIQSGEIDQPACTKTCPTGATIYGERDQLIKEAKSRIKNNPDVYLDHIYGEEEVGGTNVLYITTKDCPLDFLNYYSNRPGDKNKDYGMPDISKPIPRTTSLAMKSVPFAFFGMGVVMSSAYWIIKRRQKLENEPEQKTEDGNEQDK